MIRVRFAPSPTGLLHIGNARAAVLCWLFARRHGGQFMLRIDDTDRERSTEAYAEAIQEDLAWLGLTHDLFAKQSNRFDRYTEVMQKLIDSGRLYPCYETPEELDFKRKRQLAKGEPPIYDRAALLLTHEERAKFEAEGRKPHWRFKLLPGKISWNDHIRGPVEFSTDNLGDQVLVRADGVFLYTLASVTDDIDFAITHIVRGEDHVTNTALQIQLFEAITGAPCTVEFAHFTMFLDKSGQALSKRLGSLSLQSMREKGLEPMTISSLLARLGTSMPIEPVLSLDELAKNFDFSIFSRTAPHFDDRELDVLNHKLLTITPYERVKDRLPISIDSTLWGLIRGNLDSVSDISAWKDVFSDDLVIEKHIDADYLRDALDTLPVEPWDIATWSLWTNVLKEKSERKGRALFMPLRQALTGHDHGPEMKDLLPYIGYDRAVSRLTKAIG
ncbi:MAG: glutamate--tRNA ligase [Pseudomonadota bacterium]